MALSVPRNSRASAVLHTYHTAQVEIGGIFALEVMFSDFHLQFICFAVELWHVCFL